MRLEPVDILDGQVATTGRAAGEGPVRGDG